MHVEEQDIEKMAELLNTIPGVTHNYIRTHELNMWFTLTVDSEDSFKSVVDRIEASKLTRRVIRLAQSEQFKIGVSFDLGGDR
jgi:DNA-binding Lrp family transcriptional regulator